MVLLVDCRDRDGFSALAFASQFQQAEVVRALLAAGANSNIADRWGNTPLTKAVYFYRGNGECVVALLRGGADPDRKNSHGKSPRDLATTIANYDVRKYFE